MFTMSKIMNNSDRLEVKDNEVRVDELMYLEHIITEIEEYFEYMKNEEKIKVSSATTKILEDISNRLYEKTQHIRKSIGLPHCL